MALFPTRLHLTDELREREREEERKTKRESETKIYFIIYMFQKLDGRGRIIMLNGVFAQTVDNFSQSHTEGSMCA